MRVNLVVPSSAEPKSAVSLAQRDPRLRRKSPVRDSSNGVVGRIVGSGNAQVGLVSRMMSSLTRVRSMIGRSASPVQKRTDVRKYWWYRSMCQPSQGDAWSGACHRLWQSGLMWLLRCGESFISNGRTRSEGADVRQRNGAGGMLDRCAQSLAPPRTMIYVTSNERAFVGITPFVTSTCRS